jgi:hypothetical protein
MATTTRSLRKKIPAKPLSEKTVLTLEPSSTVSTHPHHSHNTQCEVEGTDSLNARHFDVQVRDNLTAARIFEFRWRLFVTPFSVTAYSLGTRQKMANTYVLWKRMLVALLYFAH